MLTRTCLHCQEPVAIDSARAVCPRCGAGIRPEVRCAWCTRWTNENDACGECGTISFPARDYAVARSLVMGGVDRFALPARVAALTDADRARARDVYRSQWLLVSRRIREVRACEAHLRSRGYSDEVDDELAPAMPAPRSTVEDLSSGPGDPFGDDLATLERILEHSPRRRTRMIAAVALLRRGVVNREVIDQSRRAMADVAPLRFEAATALGGWRVRRQFVLDRWQRAGFVEVLDEALKEPQHRIAAAAALAHLAGRGDPTLTAELERGLTHDDPDVAFDCALALGEESILTAALEEGDPDKATLALRSLAAHGSPSALELLEEADAERRRVVLASFPAPLSPLAVDAYLRAAARDDPAFRSEALRQIRRERFEELSPATRERIGLWLEEHAPLVELTELLELLSWAFHLRDAPDTLTLRRDDPSLASFLRATTSALRDATTAARVLAASESAFHVWLCAGGEDERDALAAWLTHPETAGALAEALFSLHGQLDRSASPGDARAIEWFLKLWDEDAPAWAEALHGVLERTRGRPGRTELLAAFWSRFVERPAERRLIAHAFEAWRQDLHSLAELDENAPGARDAVEWFRIWSDAEPGYLWKLTERVIDRVTLPQIEAFTAAVLDAALRRIPDDPLDGVLAVFKTSARVCGFIRDPDDEPQARAAAELLASRMPAVRSSVAASPVTGESKDRGTKFLEDIDVELRLIAEVEGARREAQRQDEERTRLEREREEARQRELARAQQLERLLHQSLDSQRGDEPPRRDGVPHDGDSHQNGTPRRDGDLRRNEDPRDGTPRDRSSRDEPPRSDEPALSIEPLAPLLGSEPPKTRLRPDIPTVPLDDEPVAEGPLPTVFDYVECLKAMSKGPDVIAVLSSRGISIAAWTAAGEAWGRVMRTRQDVALRCGALLQAEWR